MFSLTRATANGKEFMHKQELIDTAEASGLSRVPIAYDDLINLFLFSVYSKLKISFILICFAET